MNIWLASSACSVAIAFIVYVSIDTGPVTEFWRRYTAHLQTLFSFLFIDMSPGRFAAIHMALCTTLFVLSVYTASLVMGLLSLLLAIAPPIVLDRRKDRKRDEISEQLAPWLTTLSSSLASSPNITDAFAVSIGLVQSPLREEIDLLVKEIRLGEHLDRAMHRSADRIKSPLFSSVMTTLLVARQSGGNLPEILDKSSGTLREMERLAGVVRTKTAEGKSQTFVLALLPFVLAAGLHKINPTMLPVLMDSSKGQIILGCSVGLWITAILLATHIVKVDI